MAVGPQFAIQWIMDDNSAVDFTGKPQKFIQFAAAVGVYYSQIVHYNAGLKEQIRAAQDLEALNAVNINEGWPS